jgi:hypothetical protein
MADAVILVMEICFFPSPGNWRRGGPADALQSSPPEQEKDIFQISSTVT